MPFSNSTCGAERARLCSRKLAEPEAADLGLANELLRVGLDAIDDAVLRVYGKALPRSGYTVVLLEMTPRLVEPLEPVGLLQPRASDHLGS